MGIIDESEINNASYVWFNMVLEALGKRLNFESISALYGNSFCKDASKVVQAANPLKKLEAAKASGISALVGKTTIVSPSTDKDTAKKTVENSLGDMSWADGLF